jgi:hypothetical protein
MGSLNGIDGDVREGIPMMTDSRLEHALGRVLSGGSLLSTALLAIGLLIGLMATPILCVVEYVQRRDWLSVQNYKNLGSTRNSALRSQFATLKRESVRTAGFLLLL